jgi:hypothetical protein
MSLIIMTIAHIKNKEKITPLALFNLSVHIKTKKSNASGIAASWINWARISFSKVTRKYIEKLPPSFLKK